jgi:hypothetical protein
MTDSLLRALGLGIAIPAQPGPPPPGGQPGECVEFIRGDVNRGGQVTITDASFYLDTGLLDRAPGPCPDAADLVNAGVPLAKLPPEDASIGRPAQDDPLFWPAAAHPRFSPQPATIQSECTSGGVA